MSRLSYPARLLPLALLLAACEQHPGAIKTSSPASMQQLEGTWLQSAEETRGDTLVYRPNTYRFPPARGRTGFKIGPNGRFEQYDIAPTDGLTGRKGTWTPERNTRLHVHLDDQQERDYTLEIISLENKILEIRRL